MSKKPGTQAKAPAPPRRPLPNQSRYDGTECPIPRANASPLCETDYSACTRAARFRESRLRAGCSPDHLYRTVSRGHEFRIPKLNAGSKSARAAKRWEYQGQPNQSLHRQELSHVWEIWGSSAGRGPPLRIYANRAAMLPRDTQGRDKTGNGHRPGGGFGHSRLRRRQEHAGSGRERNVGGEA